MTKGKATIQQQIEQVLGHISDGMSVRKSCEAVGIAPSTFLKYVDGEQYARARDACADVHFDEISDLERQCLEGELEPPKFKAVLDSRKWRLARMRPKMYGDKVNVEHTGDKEKPVAVEVGVSPAVQDVLERLQGLQGTAEE